jgi:hypothetical protein
MGNLVTTVRQSEVGSRETIQSKDGFVSGNSPNKYDEYKDEGQNLQKYGRYASKGLISDQNTS